MNLGDPIGRGEFILKRHVSQLVIVLIGSVLLIGGSSASGQTGGGGGSSYRPGDLVRDGGIGIIAPRRGIGVYAHSHGESVFESLAVETSEDGTVRVIYNPEAEFVSGEEQSAGSGGGGGSGECSEDGKNQHVWMERQQIQWYFNRSSTPSTGVTANEAEAAIRDGGTNWSHLNNNCGYSDNVWVSFSYLGSTSRAARIDSNSNCLGSDDHSVVAFGDLPASDDGYACTYYTLHAGWDEGFEYDAKLNSYEASWTVNPLSSDCRSALDVESLMTHERGHNIGHAHVSNDVYDNLTMSRYHEGPCQRSERSLGLGDIRAVREKYAL